jgi:hypothetical protein
VFDERKRAGPCRVGEDLPIIQVVTARLVVHGGVGEDGIHCFDLLIRSSGHARHASKRLDLRIHGEMLT